MTSALVSLLQPEIKWTRPEQPLVVGKDILELLSTSMYVDPMSMYREYVQNSADAIDLAQSGGLLHGPGRVDVRMDQSTRTVFIRDNGSGLGRDQFVPQLTALGGSKKRGTGARGFRGVGRLAGLAFCQELIFGRDKTAKPRSTNSDGIPARSDRYCARLTIPRTCVKLLPRRFKRARSRYEIGHSDFLKSSFVEWFGTETTDFLTKS